MAILGYAEDAVDLVQTLQLVGFFLRDDFQPLPVVSVAPVETPNLHLSHCRSVLLGVGSPEGAKFLWICPLLCLLLKLILSDPFLFLLFQPPGILCHFSSWSFSDASLFASESDFPELA